jgi:hypothetical protein
MEPAFVPTNAS